MNRGSDNTIGIEHIKPQILAPGTIPFLKFDPEILIAGAVFIELFEDGTPKNNRQWYPILKIGIWEKPIPPRNPVHMKPIPHRLRHRFTTTTFNVCAVEAVNLLIFQVGFRHHFFMTHDFYI